MNKVKEIKKSWLLETPVLLKFFVRTETLRRTFDVIREVRPKVLFLAGDGPRNADDLEKIEKCHEILEDIDWECDVHRYYFEENLGVLESGRTASKKAFEVVDRLIFLEDDMLCSKSFFWFCQEMLEKYKDDMRILSVCAQNLEGVSKSVKYDYFFAHINSSGANGIWKNRWELQDYTYPVFEDQYTLEILKDQIPKERKNHIVRASNDREEYLKKPDAKSSEVARTLNFYLYNMVNIIPQKNMAVSIGISSESAHTPDSLDKIPKGIRRVFLLPLYELEFPLKHPEYVIPDSIYEKKWYRIHADGYPLIKIYRLLERGVLSLKSDGISKTIGQAKVKLKKRIINKSDKNG